jgi:hypothetical protein
MACELPQGCIVAGLQRMHYCKPVTVLVGLQWPRMCTARCVLHYDRPLALRNFPGRFGLAGAQADFAGTTRTSTGCFCAP